MKTSQGKWTLDNQLMQNLIQFSVVTSHQNCVNQITNHCVNLSLNTQMPSSLIRLIRISLGSFFVLARLTFYETFLLQCPEIRRVWLWSFNRAWWSGGW